MHVLIQESERSCIWLGDRFCPFLLFVFFLIMELSQKLFFWGLWNFPKSIFWGIMELSQKYFFWALWNFPKSFFFFDYGTFPNVVFPPSFYWLNKGDRKIEISQTAAFRLSIINGFCLMVFNATFNKYFSYIMVVSFIGGGNRSFRREPPTCRKSLTNFIT